MQEKMELQIFAETIPTETRNSDCELLATKNMTAKNNCRYQNAARCFSPIADRQSRVLILGTMPGNASLTAHQYYAHPQNAFWKIMGTLVGASQDIPYQSRLDALRSHGIALWDVLASCTRDGSLDSAIDASSITPNDFSSFFSRNPGIADVYFNGTMAEAFFRRHVLPSLGDRQLNYRRLPSTSPANASMTYAEKHEAWKVIVSHTGRQERDVAIPWLPTSRVTRRRNDRNAQNSSG
jgi:hypoxanthine-DNA glycosylase